MMRKGLIGHSAILAAALFCLPATAFSQSRDSPLLTGWGMSAFVGGGFGNFTNDAMRDFAQDMAGIWEARLVAGTHNWLAIEGAYQGSAQGINALGLERDANLVSTGLEANARLNFTLAMIQPYLVAGAAWKRYDLTNVDTNTSAVSDADNLFEVPLGVGMSFQAASLIFDVRGVYRQAFGEDLIAGQDVPMHNWGTTARVGFEF